MKRIAVSLFFIAASFHAICDDGQKSTESAIPAVTAQCPAPADVESHQLHGLWQVKLYDGPLPEDSRQPLTRAPQQQGSLLFERHPEHAASLRGALKLKQTQETHWLSGDLDEGELILDESDDGRRISAVWVVYPTVGSCGREFRGNRRMAEDDRLQMIVLTRTPSWQ